MPVTIDKPVEKWTGKIREVTLGATREQGGTRSRSVTLGGETSLPFLRYEGQFPHRPVIAVEVNDVAPVWSPVLQQAWGEALQEPATWAQEAVTRGADLISLVLQGTDPEGANHSADQAAQTVRNILTTVDVPLIVYGLGQPEIDNEVLVKVAEAAAGERLALGLCEQSNYRTIVAACLANDHVAVARAPIDVNIQKQLNILITDMGLPADRILMDPTTGALGYGLEYTYSVMERLRIAALQGDSMTQMPMICTVGEEAWRSKEAMVTEGVPDEWGKVEQRAVAWEVVTAIALLEAGAGLVVLRHPQSVTTVRAFIDSMLGQ